MPRRSGRTPVRFWVSCRHTVLLPNICVLYADAVCGELVPRARFAEELRAAPQKVLEAEKTLVSHRDFLTDADQEFFDLTKQVVRYSEE
jgi:hypothetical protein